MYDSAHLGHARNYVTFDVIRRIMSDYFNYDVFSVMNITDIDDKIITRARKEYLFGNYVGSNPIVTQEMLEDVKSSVVADIAKCNKKMQEVAVDEEKSEAERNGEKQLLQKRVVVAEAFLKDFVSFNVGTSSQPLLEKAKDSFVEQLDQKLGGTEKNMLF